MISVVIPCWNERGNVTELCDKLLQFLPPEHEILFVDDGSIDGTKEELEQLQKNHHTVKPIFLRKHLGKSPALTAGFSAAKGDIVITMDADLQDDPKEISRFLDKIKNADLVVGWKKIRKDPITKRVPSKFFNWLTNTLTGVKLHDSNCGFKCFRKEVIESIDVYGELHRYVPAIAYMHGFKIAEITVEHHARKRGKSKFGVTRLLNGFLDLMTITFLMKFAQRPMHLFGPIGLLLLGIGTVINLHLFYIRVFLSELIGNRPLLTLGVLLMVLGVQFVSVGLLGEMITNLAAKKGGGTA